MLKPEDRTFGDVLAKITWLSLFLVQAERHELIMKFQEVGDGFRKLSLREIQVQLFGILLL